MKNLKSIAYTILTLGVVLLLGCSKEVYNAKQEKPYVSTVHSSVINNLGSSRGDYAALLSDFLKRYDGVVHIQSYNTLGNQLLGGLPSLSFSGGLPVYPNNKIIKVSVCGNVFENGGNSLLHYVPASDKQSFAPCYGSTTNIKLENESGLLADIQAYVPKQPEIILNDGQVYQPGYGISVPANRSFPLQWRPDDANPLGGVLITISPLGSETTNQQLHIITADNGSYNIGADLLARFAQYESIDIAISRGAYHRSTFDGDKSFLYYSIAHTHIALNLTK
ncbi:MAG: hypothetical protein NZM35_11935 [Chitinophagales bacterium]|nr:hypothetical protein [Chitinophagales bacterium]MDW8420086.1 hypothetical protein [Chitinophagales bacterium]